MARGMLTWRLFLSSSPAVIFSRTTSLRSCAMPSNERVQRRAYTVLRGELEVAKDRIRALQGLPGEDAPLEHGVELPTD